MKLLKLPLLIICLLSIFISQAQIPQNVDEQTTFESFLSVYEEDGKLHDHYGIWIDGGSDAYTVESEKYRGFKSFVITKQGTVEKPFYASLYTMPIDFSENSDIEIDFKYLITNSTGDFSPAGTFAVEISHDAGDTFSPLATYTVADLPIIKSSKTQWISDCSSACGILEFFCSDTCETTADAIDFFTNNTDDLRSYWNEASIKYSGPELSSKTTVLRIKSYLSNTDLKTKIYIDEININYSGPTPQLSKDVLTVDSDSVNTKTVVGNDFQDFNDSLTDWGIWQDGGRNAYLTSYLADRGIDYLSEEGYGVCLRNFYSGKANDDVNGDELGFQKSTYSSIVTDNLDFTEIQDLDLNFSFIAFNMKSGDDHVTDKTQVTNIDGELVDVYVPGPDYIDISVSTDSGYTFKHLKKLTYGVDFVNLERQEININIPGNFLATDDDTGNVLLNTAGFTTTTQIKIQCFSDTDAQQFYIDSIDLIKYGSNSSPKGTPRDLDWSSYKQTYLYADPSQMDGDAYEYINSKLLDPDVYESGSWRDASQDEDLSTTIPGAFGCVEHSDCSDHSTLTDIPWVEGQRHIEQVLDNDLEKYTFNFHSHLDEDTERCRTDAYDDRMRCEIKTKHDSGDDKKGLEGETHFYAWKMKLPSDFKGSNKFTHLHQIKPVAGDHFGMPTITLTATSKVDSADADSEDSSADVGDEVLKLRYAGLSNSQVTADVIDLVLLKGRWIQFVEKVHFGISDEGRYELLVYDPINGSIDNPIFTFESYSFQTWKGAGESGDLDDPDCFVRPKWGIYRSNLEAEKLGDEILGFADFTILEVTDKQDGLYGDITKFAEYIETLEGTDVTEEYTSIPALIEAEDYSEATEGRTETKDNGETNVGWIDEGEYLSYNINVPISGVYTIDFNVASKSKDILFDIYEGDSKIGSIDASSTGDWYDWSGNGEISTTVNLNKGDQVIKIVATDGGWNFNSFHITSEVEYTSIPALIEAEDYSEATEGRTETKDNGETNVGWIDEGEYLSYNINVPISGAYTIDFNVASKSKDILFDIYEGDSKIGSIDASSTGDWYNWSGSGEISTAINLNKGDQVIKIVAAGGGWNFNSFHITSEEEYTSIPALIEAEDYSEATEGRTETKENGEINVGWIDEGEYLSYNINVPISGAYTIDFSVASKSNNILFDIYEGDFKIGSVDAGSTGDWYSWSDNGEISATVNLTKGNRVIKIVATGGGWNFNSFNIFEYIEPELLKDDLLFLDPQDSFGNKWFETEQDKSDFLNAILTATGTTLNTAPASIKEDLFIAIVRSDEDREYDNKSYHTLVCTKSTSDDVQQVFNDLEHSFVDRHIYSIKFYLGGNITYAKFLFDEDSPSGFWGEELVNTKFEHIITLEENNAVRDAWLNGYVVDFESVMNSITLWAY